MKHVDVYLIKVSASPGSCVSACLVEAIDLVVRFNTSVELKHNSKIYTITVESSN